MLKKIVIFFCSLAMLVMVLLIVVFFYLRAQPNPHILFGQIFYDGPINVEAYEQIKSLYDSAKKKPTKLRINSPGGSSLAGILIGRFMYENEMTVIVYKKCNSSCANFIFTGARQKILNDDAIVLYHGGSFQENITRQRVSLIKGVIQNAIVDFEHSGKEGIASFSDSEEKLFSYFPAYENVCAKEYLTAVDDDITIKQRAIACTAFLQQTETEFYQMVNVDPMIPYYGQRGEYKTLYESYKYLGFYYDVDSMARMGVTNISINGGKWRVSNSPLFDSAYLVLVKE